MNDKRFAYGKHENNRGVPTNLPANNNEFGGGWQIYWTGTEDHILYLVSS
jgi:hypothetical protein